jgi:hypothetical protein
MSEEKDCKAVFHHCDKISEKISIKEERPIAFTVSVHGSWSHYCGPVIRQNIIAGECDRAEPVLR